MNNKEMFEKGILTVMGAGIGTKFGMLLPALSFLGVLMVIDYVSGMLAAKKESFENPNDSRFGWSSKRSILGIYKKLGYILTIFVAVSIDYLIFKFAKEIGLTFGTNTIFGLLVCVWFIINELISILENIGRMGTEFPEFLKNILADLKDNLDDKKSNKR